MFKHVAAARAAALIAAAIFAGAPTHAATADPHEYQSLQEQSARDGAVRVMVNLDDIITLDAVAKSKARLK
ncbi:MAG: hypothetical protein V4787_10975 [Pseudomonadota bacterium]